MRSANAPLMEENEPVRKRDRDALESQILEMNGHRLHPDTPEAQPKESQPLNELVKKLSRDATSLFKHEVELAKADMELRVERLRRHALAVSVAIATLHVAALSLAACAILLLSTVVATWAAALLVGVCLLLVGAALLHQAKRTSLAMNQTAHLVVDNARKDVSTVRRAIK